MQVRDAQDAFGLRRSGDGMSATTVTRGYAAPPPQGITYVVQRGKMVSDLKQRAEQAGIMVIYAPKGFGKTSVLLQYADAVRRDPARGFAEVIECQDAQLDELMVQLEGVEEQRPRGNGALVALDNVPLYEDGGTERLVARVRELREHGFGVALTCLPSNKPLVYALGDSVKVNAQALKVQAREYSDWARTFSIAGNLDVYGLTQGIPQLVAALRAAVARGGVENDVLERAIVDVVGDALADLAHAQSPLLRPLCLMQLLGEGSLVELERCGMPLSAQDVMRLSHDCSVLEIDAAANTFRCLGSEEGARQKIREVVAALFPDLPPRAVRAHLRAGRCDCAVRLAERFVADEDALDVVAPFGLALVLAGHATYIRRVVKANGGLSARHNLPTQAMLAGYLASLALGDYRTARVARGVLEERLDQVAAEVDAAQWSCAREFSRLWGGLPGIELPAASAAPDAVLPAEQALRASRMAAHDLMEGAGATTALSAAVDRLQTSDEINVAYALFFGMRLLEEVLSGEFDAVDERDELLEGMVAALKARRLVPIYSRLQMVAAMRRLFACQATCEDTSFSDAANEATRCADLGMQLFCMLLDSWQALSLGQVVNARFRCQQVQKLCMPEATFMQSWIALLDTLAYLRDTSRLKIVEEAELLNLGLQDTTSAEAWCTALRLSAARYTAELSAWYSLHKREMLEPSFRLTVRLALKLAGKQADAVRHLIPAGLAEGYCVDEPGKLALGDARANGTSVREAERDEDLLGQVTLKLFGGFRAERNGHQLTSSLWRRKRTGMLAARLVLAGDTFVGRHALCEELWPNSKYDAARDSLYVTLSALRRGMGQTNDGPQYVILQGEGVSLNADYVTSDVSRFDALARQILLSRQQLSGLATIELCLKLEQVYHGALYVPDVGDATFFVHMRKKYQARFVDCMIKGAQLALVEEDTGVARWMVEAALREDPVREDLIRCALRVYEMDGRRNEAVALYSGHMAQLEQSLRDMPEPETRAAYEDIVRRMKRRGLL